MKEHGDKFQRRVALLGASGSTWSEWAREKREPQSGDILWDRESASGQRVEGIHA